VSLFLLDTARQDYAGVPGVEQAFLMVEMLAGMAMLGYALTRGGLRRAALPTPAGSKIPRAARAAARLVLCAFWVALIRGVFGYIRLGRLLSAGILGSGALAVMLYAGFLVVTGLIGFALRVWPLQRLQMVQRHRALVERRVRLALGWAWIGAWLFRTLDYIGLFQPTLSLATAVLTARLQRGSMSISLGDILDFVLTVWVAYLVSAFIRFVLQEDVYPRIHLSRGISYALSSLLNYVIVALGFVLALGALGMDLSKVTLLAGAFGVGIGFGLQSVVNNFVSGLILLFERPIHVGDAVEVGDVTGEVRRIGIRASTVRTGQGAEIIVPNAQLIAERVTNWTLSDRQRRIDLPVGVSYSAPPRKVIEMLETVAHAHPGVLRTPAPKAYLTGFGDSAINFELRAWTDQFEGWFQIRSELATAVYDAGHAAGISFPLPQREVRVLHDGPDPSAANASNTLPSASLPEGAADTRTGQERALGDPGRGGRG
jgi:small-conductance mechanosensitive channel